MVSMRELVLAAKEPTSWGGIGLVVMAITGLSGNTWEAVVAAIVALAGLVQVFLPEEERKQQRLSRKNADKAV